MPWVNYTSPFGTFSQWVDDPAPVVSPQAPPGFTVTPGTPRPEPSYPSASNLPVGISIPDGKTTSNDDGSKKNNTGGGGGGGGGGGSPTPSPTNAAPVSATPALPTFTPMPSNKNFKVAPSDIIQFDDSNIEIQLITNLLFEDIGAVELADMSRSDLIDGQEVIYKPIANLPELRRDFDPNKIISNIPQVDYFSRFLINLLSRGMHEPYFDDEGNLVIEIDKVLNDEKIEVEILSNGTIEIIGEI
jgi:hypothetical protein